VQKVYAVILLAGLGLFSDVDAQEKQALEHFERGALFHLNGSNEKAIKEFKKSLLYNKKNPNTHFYLALVYEVKSKIGKAITHMLKAEKYFEAEGRTYWQERSRKRIDEYYFIYGLNKEDFEK